MSRIRVPSIFFVFAIVQDRDRFLIVRETKHGQSWYAPAGGLEPGETIEQACIRETWEEAHVHVEPGAIVHVDQNWYPPEHEGAPPSSWWRFIVLAKPRGSFHTVKTSADRHSLEARWLTLSEIARLNLRHPEVLTLFGAHANACDSELTTARSETA